MLQLVVRLTNLIWKKWLFKFKFNDTKNYSVVRVLRWLRSLIGSYFVQRLLNWMVVGVLYKILVVLPMSHCFLRTDSTFNQVHQSTKFTKYDIVKNLNRFLYSLQQQSLLTRDQATCLLIGVPHKFLKVEVFFQYNHLFPWTFDCLPLYEMFLDLWLGRQTFDENGRFASQGHINTELLQLMESHMYFQLPPPKTTGRELFTFSVSTLIQQIMKTFWFFETFRFKQNQILNWKYLIWDTHSEQTKKIFQGVCMMRRKWIRIIFLLWSDIIFHSLL